MPDDRFQLDLEHASYGKDGVHALVSAPQPGAADAVRDITFTVRVWGPFDASYRSGDNAEIVPSDSLRRHLLQITARRPQDSPEAISAAAVTQIKQANPSFTAVRVEAHERIWEPIADHSSLAGLPARFGSSHLTAGDGVELVGGVDELQLMVTGGSAFTGFRRDALTVQSEAVDRPLCGTLWARWHWLAGHEPTLAQSRAVVADLAAAFADRPSNAIQELVAAAGADLLGRVPEIAEVRLRFAALPLTPFASGLVADAAPGTRAHEVGGGPPGVTEALVRRAPA